MDEADTLLLLGAAATSVVEEEPLMLLIAAATSAIEEETPLLLLPAAAASVVELAAAGCSSWLDSDIRSKKQKTMLRRATECTRMISR